MPTIHLTVDNLKCDGCSSTVRRRISGLRGVLKVEVDPATGSVRVEHDGSTDIRVVTTLLTKLGYPEHGAGGWKEHAVSYVSCALGRLHGDD